MSSEVLSREDAPVVIIGAGPAGLTAAHELALRKVAVRILEADGQVGGLAKTITYKGFRFDIGGHRFFSKMDTVNGLWRAMLGDKFLLRPRLSRILYRGRYFDYPLKPANALLNLGFFTSAAILMSYLRVKLFPIRPEATFEDWASNRFGPLLYTIFFKTYTEKVWGIPCSTLSARWAAQRIKGLSLRTALYHMFFKGRDKTPPRTLIEEFHYPRLGPGMMWEAFRDRVETLGGRISLRTRVSRLHHDGQRVHSVEFEHNNELRRLNASHVISTMPLRHLVSVLSPGAPPIVIAAVNRLKYRDFLTVALIVDEPELFPDNWIYIHDESVKVARIQNFKNWSPDMVPDQTKTCLGLEYFCFEGDSLWTMPDGDLITLAKRELNDIGLAESSKVIDGAVVRVPKAYPIYDDEFPKALAVVKEYLCQFENLQEAGRNGTHRYNNMDHSMLSGILAARNVLGEHHDLWTLNEGDDYYEEIKGKGERVGC